jgi:predicted transposase YdaD
MLPGWRTPDAPHTGKSGRCGLEKRLAAHEKKSPHIALLSMQEYDVALKLLLKGSATLALHELTGTSVVQWLDVELPKVQRVQNLRLDLLGRTVEGGLIHLEVQSGNDPAMPFRIIEYCLGVRRLLGQFPRQIVLYVGEAPVNMETGLHGPGMSFEYTLIDIRTLDGDRLLESEQVGDNVIAILARLRDDKEAVHRILERIAGLAMTERETTLAQLTILAGLRHLAGTVEEEAEKMPIDLDIRDHEVLGPLFIKAEEKGLREGLQKGRQEGLQEGLHAGKVALLQRQIEKRFGALPRWARVKLEDMPESELLDLSERVLDATSLDELL